MDQRPEGVYCSWVTYPENSYLKDTILHIERVCGDGSVLVFECARSESKTILQFLKGN